MFNYPRIILILLLTCLLVPAAFAQKRHRDPPLTEELYKLFEAKRAEFEFQLKLVHEDWEGLYIYGSHHPDYLWVTKKHGFLASATDHGGGMRLNYGPVELDGKRLRLRPLFDKESINYEPVADVYVLVKWDDYRYLVPETNLRAFAYAVHSRLESGLIEFPTKSGDTRYEREGFPDLPEEFQAIMSMKAVKAKIVSVETVAGDEYFQESSVTVNKGRKHGVGVGMALFYLGKDLDIKFVVTEVNEKTSKLSLSYFGYRTSERRGPKPGMKLTSKPEEDRWDIE